MDIGNLKWNGMEILGPHTKSAEKTFDLKIMKILDTSLAYWVYQNLSKVRTIFLSYFPVPSALNWL